MYVHSLLEGLQMKLPTHKRFSRKTYRRWWQQLWLRNWGAKKTWRSGMLQENDISVRWRQQIPVNEQDQTAWRCGDQTESVAQLDPLVPWLSEQTKSSCNTLLLAAKPSGWRVSHSKYCHAPSTRSNLTTKRNTLTQKSTFASTGRKNRTRASSVSSSLPHLEKSLRFSRPAENNRVSQWHGDWRMSHCLEQGLRWVDENRFRGSTSQAKQNEDCRVLVLRLHGIELQWKLLLKTLSNTKTTPF